jgi:hypothetical protein
VTSLYLHAKRISKMGGAMIRRLETDYFKAIGTIGRGRILELFYC